MKRSAPIGIPLLMRSAVVVMVVLLGAMSSKGAPPEPAVPSTDAAIASGSFDLAAAIKSASPGDTLRVPAGVYPGLITINTPLRLIAEPGAILDGQGVGTVVEITAPDVTLSGFTVRNTGDSLDKENTGIAVTAPRAIIEGNTLDDVLFGIYVKSSDGTIVRGNTIGGKQLAVPRRGDGIRLWQSSGCVIEDNTIRNSRDTVMWFSDGTIIRRNHVSNGRYGMHFMYSDDNLLEDNLLEDNSVGAFLMYSRGVTLRRNVLARNRGPSGFGIGLKDMDVLRAEDNLFVGNRIGLHIDNSPSEVDVYHHFTGNIFAYNDAGLAFMPSVQRNVFVGNSFLENIEQVALLGTGHFEGNEFTRDGQGNWWSDYRGYDLDNDGIGDIPYKASGLFEALMSREPRLRLFLFSPAQTAVEMAARAFPVVAPTPRVTDSAPLMAAVPLTARIRPTITQTSAWPAAVILLAVGVLCVAAGWRPITAPPSPHPAVTNTHT